MVEPVGRIFLAVDLTSEARQALSGRVMEMARHRELPGRSTPPRNWHMTLWFLGDVARDRFEMMCHYLSEAPLGDAFRCRFGEWGSFPRPRRASVLWVGVSRGSSSLCSLAAATKEAVTGAGIPLSERPFSPHLTLSRIRPPQDVRALLDSAPSAEVDMTVREVTAFRSHMGGGPPRYEALERFPLS
ncbi:MAG: RNA 2',3'-cyclic phosphodiesterase [Acidimicrobiia bacterium]|nr:RNA 2',3'-cyclic phosphodiesterase [Acidimicrobiia bacterium]